MLVLVSLFLYIYIILSDARDLERVLVDQVVEEVKFCFYHPYNSVVVHFYDHMK